MDDEGLLLHPMTKAQADSVVSKPPHALIIQGPAGSGKRTLAEYLAAKLLNTTNTDLLDDPYYTVIEKSADKQEISIDALRSIIKKLHLKPVDSRNQMVKRVILIDNAHLASSEAQNAVLKIIEEPPESTVFIITAISDTALLPTISSRADKLKLIPVGLTAAKLYYQNKYSDRVIETAWNLSGGSAGLLDALLHGDTNHPLRQSVETVKTLISSSRYERLLLVDKLSGERQSLILLLDALNRVLIALHHGAIKAENDIRAKKIIKARKLVSASQHALDNNVSGRLVALRLAISLSI